MAVLVHMTKDGGRRHFILGDRPARIGRADDADIHLEEPLVSRTHARIEKNGDVWVLQDLNSRNSTHVNGERIHEHRLIHGDEILFARARCLFLAVDDNETSGSLRDDGLIVEEP
ncbi:MAG: FHA domain-containing protein [Vicinamibacteria bacterium]|nr:FHA domain-containing protein [Vicinamibacteria bacterium]